MGRLYKLVCVIAPMIFIACSDTPYEYGDNEDDVILTLTARSIDAVKTEESVAENTMHTLRVVIASRNDAGYWNIEHNRLEKFNGIGVRISDEMKFPVEGSSYKRIYLIANESQVKKLPADDDLSGTSIDLSDDDLYKPDRNGLAPVDNVICATLQDGSVSEQGVPMSAMYEVRMGKKPQTVVLHIVRAWSKITFSYNNETACVPLEGEPVAAKKRRIKLLGWSVEKLADRSYLIPHVNRNELGTFTVIDSELKTVKELDGDWTDWMAGEAEKGEAKESYEWLTDYSIPDEADHSLYTFWYDTEKDALSAPVIFPKDNEYGGADTYNSKAVYISESKNEEWYDNAEHNADLGLQQYRLTVVTNELDYDLADNPENWKAASYTAVLPNLLSLFRNTHVHVRVTFKGEGEFAIYAEIQPWKTSAPVTGELIPEMKTK